MFELTEDLIELAKQETFSHNKTPLRVAALYLIYSLYFKQPFRPKTRYGGAFKKTLKNWNLCLFRYSINFLD